MAAQPTTTIEGAAPPYNTKRARLLALLNKIETLETKIGKMEATTYADPNNG